MVLMLKSAREDEEGPRWVELRRSGRQFVDGVNGDDNGRHDACPTNGVQLPVLEV